MRPLFLIASVLLLTACGESSIQAHVVVPESAQMVKLAVSNMTCSTCGPTVRRDLQQVDGVYKADVDTKSKIATVDFDPAKTEIPSLTEATTNAGYPSKTLL